jgi:hypothetical protein
MENRIKEQQLGLVADRTRCQHGWANQFRLPLASLSCVPMESIRRLGLAGTEPACAQCSMRQIKLPKIGGAVLRSSQ